MARVFVARALGKGIRGKDNCLIPTESRVLGQIISKSFEISCYNVTCKLTESVPKIVISSICLKCRSQLAEAITYQKADAVPISPGV